MNGNTQDIQLTRYHHRPHPNRQRIFAYLRTVIAADVHDIEEDLNIPRQTAKSVLKALHDRGLLVKADEGSNVKTTNGRTRWMPALYAIHPDLLDETR